jgi:hypothetical protein
VVKAADAIALFAAYAALIAIATVYQTLALQALSGEADRLDAEIERHPQPAFAPSQRGDAWRLLLKALVVVVGTALVVFPLAAWSDEVARLMDPADNVPQWALLNANWLLRGLFIATALAFSYSVVSHECVGDLRCERDKSVTDDSTTSPV